MSRISLSAALLTNLVALLLFAATAGATPYASISSADGNAGTSATLHGLVYSHSNGSPATGPATYHFEYGPTAAYGSSSPGGTANGDVAETISGLTPGTLYHFRLVATDADGTTASNDGSFTTGAGSSGTADSDGDGVQGNADKCPDRYGPDRADGCPLPYGFAQVGFDKVSDAVYPQASNVNCLADIQLVGCRFHVTLRLSAASARALGLRSAVLWTVAGKADWRLKFSSGGGRDYFARSEFTIPAAAKRALRRAHKATFELSGTYAWGDEPEQPMKSDSGSTVLRFTLTSRKRAGHAPLWIHSQLPAKNPAFGDSAPSHIG